MSPNYDPATGCHYGILEVSDYPELCCFIQDHGKPATADMVQAQIRAELTDALADVDVGDLSTADENERRAYFSNIIGRFVLDESCALDLIDMEDCSFSIDEVVEACVKQALDEHVTDGDGPIDLELLECGLRLYRSGSLTLRIDRSTHCTEAHACSPCYPNAGDLDRPGGPMRTFCLPPSVAERFHVTNPENVSEVPQ